MIIDTDLRVRVLGSAKAVPDGGPVSNVEILSTDPELRAKGADFLKRMSDRIESRFGVRERYLVHKPWQTTQAHEDSSEDLAFRALRRALSVEGKGSPALLVHGTTTSSRYTGSQAASILGRLGIVAPAYEIKAGCSTSIASLHMALAFLKSGYSDVAVACGETLSKVMDPENRETWFGLADGGAALWLGKDDSAPDFAILKSYYCTDGLYSDLFTTRGGLPPTAAECESNLYSLRGDADRLRTVSRERYTTMLAEIFPPEFPLSAIDWVVPHQVNRELIQNVMKEHRISAKVVWNAREYGNLGGASVLFSMADSLERGLFRTGDRILLMSVGGGLSFAAQVWQKL